MNLILFIVLCANTIFHTAISCCQAFPNTLCHDGEKEALLKFKHHLTDASNRLESWRADNGDCCNWAGVVCHNLTGHVRELHLRNPVDILSDSYQRSCLVGSKIEDSLLDLKHLHFLDLSNNDFNFIPIPKFLGSMQSLRYLNLSWSGFGGKIPHELGNLSNLCVLAIGDSATSVESLQWLSGLSFLRHLDLSYVNVVQASDWLHVINVLPSLKELYLSDCGLDNYAPLFPCINISGLIGLDISSNGLEGPIPSCLGNLTSLKDLDLSYNSFNSSLPSWLCHLTSLSHLDLSNNQNLQVANFGFLRNMCNLRWIDFSGVPVKMEVSELLKFFPTCASGRLEHLSMSGSELYGPLLYDLGQFSNLIQLDLSSNSISGPIPESLGSLTSLKEINLGSCQLNGTLPKSLGHLIRLEYLHLENNSISGFIPESIGSLTFLKEVDLSSNILNGILPTSLGRIIRLESLNLENNLISGMIPESIGSLTSLIRLSLSENRLNGALPESVGHLIRLEYLNLENNSISGSIPESIGSLISLKELYLGSNQLSGTLPQSLGQLNRLEYLYIENNLLSSMVADSLGSLYSLLELSLSNNSLECTLTEISFANLTRLYSLEASQNPITLKVKPQWIPPFQLSTLTLSSWLLGPQFPQWLRSQTELSYLDISNTGIKDIIPVWFPNSTFLVQESFITLDLDLSSNCLTGPLLQFPFNTYRLDLSNNSLSGSIASLLCSGTNDENMMGILHLGNNNLSGEIPDCWNSWTALVSIELQNNNLAGNIPSSLGSLKDLQSLHLHNNNLSGALPSSLQNLTKLITLDLSGNNLGGNTPGWIGQSFSKIRILSLGSNNFNGYIPRKLCALRFLIILDLANNKLTGSIPTCFSNLTAMVNLSSFEFENQYDGVFQNGTFQTWGNYTYTEKVILVTKALVLEYSKNLPLMVAIDLSSNNLSGEIPETITSLVKLKSLNLSRNSLTGRIPENMGSILSLESLDLSSNQLSGNIPQGMTRMTFLSVLNLSYNRLEGRIPTSTQLQGFNASSFIGNHLCGPPMSDNCSTDARTSTGENGDKSHDHRHGFDEFYVSLAVGFVVGFWGVIGPLIYSKWWRYTYFQSLHNLWDKVWAWAMILCPRFKGRA